MKPWLTALILLLISPMLAAITIAEISFDADFSVSGAELRKASGLVLGQEYEPSKVSQAIAGIQAYLQSQGDYYVLVFNPELIALDSQHIHLQFRLRRMADSGAVRIKYSGLRHFSLSTLHNLAYTSEEGEYALVDLPRIMQRVLELYQERGYLFARVQLDSIVYEQGLVAYIQIQEGKIFEPQRYHFRGNKVTREATILKNSGLLGEKIITPPSCYRRSKI
ncbi:MAG TPA: POTRA domain-containing protein [Candidatus Cloacimonadota bacterium]|nr:POTRA domain-containing protein [Candidatus Cloacimonadota bacterium]